MSQTDVANPDDQQETQKEQVKKPVNRIPNEKYISAYSNSVQMGLTPWDTRFTFGEILGKDENDQIVIGDLATIIMSPQHAKAFLNVFIKQVSVWEDRYGEIKTPPDTEPTEEE